MKTLIFEMTIEEKNGDFFKISLSGDSGSVYIQFNPVLKELDFLGNDQLTKFFKGHEYQLRTMLHNKRLDTYFVGFKLTFVFQIEKDVAAYNDRSKIVVVDRRSSYKNYVINERLDIIDKLYTDASFQERFGTGGIAFIHENIEGEYFLYRENYEEGRGNNILELLAAIKGLEHLHGVESIRIITDSQYVRKGLSEWIVNWKLNGWKTVNGEPVKNIDLWQYFDQLSEGKYIELQWIKAHTDHFENTLCDLYARDVSLEKR